MNNKTICTKCGVKKTLKKFSWRYKAKKIKLRQCKLCMKKYNKKHYERNKIDYIRRVKQQRERIRDFIIKAKSVPCFDCGNTYPYYVMDFDHVNGQKNYTIGGMAHHRTSLEKIKEEISKCEVTCANCHRIRTFKKMPIVPKMERWLSLV